MSRDQGVRIRISQIRLPNCFNDSPNTQTALFSLYVSLFIKYRKLCNLCKGLTSNYVCLSTRHLLGKHHSTLRTLSGRWLICHRASSRSALSGNLLLPRTRRKFGDRAFAVAAPRVWNSLPTDIKLHQSTTSSFKRRLKTVLFNRGFAEHMLMTLYCTSGLLVGSAL